MTIQQEYTIINIIQDAIVMYKTLEFCIQYKEKINSLVDIWEYKEGLYYYCLRELKDYLAFKIGQIIEES